MGLLDDLDSIAGSQSQSASNKSISKSPHSNVDSRQGEALAGYNSWSVADLQAEAKKYGFRPTKDRKTMIQQLRQVQEALERKDEAEDADISMISSSSSFIRPSSPGRSSDVEEVSMSDLTMEIIRQAQSATKRTQQASQKDGYSIGSDDRSDDEGDHESNDGSGDSEVALADLAAANNSTSMDDVAPSTSDQLFKAITSDKSLYHRILLFEPVSFDEISSTAKRAGVTGLRSKETLRSWLDMQGICFYSADLTGPRQRH